MKKRATGLFVAVWLFGACVAEADIHYVSETSGAPEWPYTSPSTAATAVSAAMSAASYGDTVMVLPGCYRLRGDSQGYYRLRCGVNLVGSGADATFLGGSDLLVGEDPDPEVGECGGQTIISAFRLVDCELVVWQGMAPLKALTVTVSDCYFDGSRVRACNANNTSLTLRRCVFARMWEMGDIEAVSVNYAPILNVLDCTFDLTGSVGRAKGLWLYLTDSVLISGSRFRGCDAGVESLSPQLAPRIANCLFVDNVDGISIDGLPVAIENCTFLHNKHAVRIRDQCESAPTVRNCILWGSTEANVVVEGSDGFGVPQITFSNVEGGYPGRGNTDADPMFFLPSGDEPDLHLCAFSPCVDAGDPFSDYSNEPEPNGGRVNMGAYGNTWQARTSELVDVDGDNLRDDWEIEHFGSLDGDGLGDADGDSLSEREEYRHLSDPNDPDTDGDALGDAHEVFDLGTDPTLSDTDNDGTPDGKEIEQGTDPLDPWDALAITGFWIANDQVHVVHPVQPRCWYELQSSFFPGGPFGIVCPIWEGRFGMTRHTFVVDLSPYARFYRIEARPF
jgi:hypothetical protein